jgi:hypothetical protein
MGFLESASFERIVYNMTLLAHFFAAVFLVNGIPHFVHGVSGESFQSPFASPPGVGVSSSMVNVLWGSFNFIVGNILLFCIDSFHIGPNLDTLVTAIGGLATALALSWHFQRVRSK